MCLVDIIRIDDVLLDKVDEVLVVICLFLGLNIGCSWDNFFVVVFG